MTKWTRDETRIVCQGFRLGLDPQVIHDRCPRLTLTSIKCKLANCRYLARGAGLAHVSRLHREVWAEQS
jgi:hypothetical protein